MGRITEVAAADAERVISIVCAEIDAARDRITSEASWARLAQFFYEALLGRNTLDAAMVIAWADAGHPSADQAVRLYAAEMVDRGRDSELLVQVRAYVVKTLLRPFVPFPRGRSVVQHLLRDVWIPMVVANVAAGTGLNPTRSANTTTPSAAYFVAAGLKRRGYKIKEAEINRIYWRRNAIAAQLEASMPQVPLQINYLKVDDSAPNV